MRKKILKIGIWIIGSIVVLLIGIFIFIQTETFNKWALDFTLSKLNKSWSEKNASINVESLNGNILKGLRVNNANITVENDTLLKVQYIDLKYDVWGLLNKNITVDFITLHSPEINLINISKNRDSLIWNFTRILEPSKEVDTAVTQFDWKIVVNSFKIEDGSFRIFGNTDEKIITANGERTRLDEFDFNKLSVYSLNMDLKGEYGKAQKILNLYNLSFNTNSNFDLKHLALNAFINNEDTLTELSGFQMLTNRSDVKISYLKASDLNPLDSNAFNNLGEKELEAKINIEKFDFDDLKFFFPSLTMLDSNVSLILDAKGRYDDLYVNNLNLKLPQTDFYLKGNVKNLDKPDSLYFDVVSDNSKITPSDVKAVYTDLPDYNNIGTLYSNILYRGYITNFYTEFSIQSSTGNADGKTYLNLDDKTYNGYVSTNNLNLAPILKDNKMRSNINLYAEFGGRGFALNELSTNVNYTLSGSSMMGYNIRSSAGKLNINGYNINLNLKANSNAGAVGVAGRINISNLKNPTYTLKGRVNNFNASAITKNSSDKSNINLAFDVSGRGIDLNSINGKYNFDIGNSSYGGNQIPATTVDALILAGTDNSSIHVNNDAAEFNAKGTFNLSGIIDALLYNISEVSTIAAKKMNPDTTISQPVLPRRMSNVKMNYTFVTKDSAKLYNLTQPFGINFAGNLKGNFQNNSSGFNSENNIQIRRFTYLDTAIILRNFNSQILYSNDYTLSSSPDNFNGVKLDLIAKSDYAKYENNKIDTLNMKLNLADMKATLDVYTKMDSTTYGKIAGAMDLSGKDIKAKFDSVLVNYGTYKVSNNEEWLITYVPDKEVQIDRLGLFSNNMVLNVNGVYSFNDESDINLKAENLNLNDIYNMVNPYDTTLSGEKNPYPVKGQILSLDANVKGTMQDATLKLKMNTDVLKYDTTGIGTIIANIDYQNEILKPDIVLKNQGESGSLSIVGEVPIVNILAGHDSTYNLDDKPSNLKLTANNFQIQYFTKLIPGIADFRGLLDGEINASGTIENPDLKGNLSMREGLYFLDLTGMYYRFLFDINTANNNLVINNFRVFNTSDDEKFITLSGIVDFTGYTLKNIDLTTSGDFVVLDNSAEDNALGITGFLHAGIGTPPITIKGNLKNLDVKGQLVIKDATVTSLPNTGRGYESDDKNIVFVDNRDTVTKTFAVNKTTYENINPFKRAHYKLIDTTKQVSIMELLNLDVNVKTTNNMYVSIDFKNITRDRLFGEIEADLDVKSTNGELYGYGTVNIVGNSYYRFYRNFKVKDSRVVFDGPIARPRLDIRAVYENTKSTEQYGSVTNAPIQVVLSVKGTIDDPQISLSLYENGTEMQGNDATADAITYLLFGKYKNELSSSERQSVATGIGSTVGALYVSSFFGQIIRDIIPFIKDAEFNYTEGGIQNTNVNVTSEIYDADVTVGSRVINNTTYLEFNVEYPLNRLIKINLPEDLVIQLSREQVFNTVIYNNDARYSTGIKAIYKIKF